MTKAREALWGRLMELINPQRPEEVRGLTFNQQVQYDIELSEYTANLVSDALASRPGTTIYNHIDPGDPQMSLPDFGHDLDDVDGRDAAQPCEDGQGASAQAGWEPEQYEADAMGRVAVMEIGISASAHSSIMRSTFDKGWIGARLWAQGRDEQSSRRLSRELADVKQIAEARHARIEELEQNMRGAGAAYVTLHNLAEERQRVMNDQANTIGSQRIALEQLQEANKQLAGKIDERDMAADAAVASGLPNRSDERERKELRRSEMKDSYPQLHNYSFNSGWIASREYQEEAWAPMASRLREDMDKLQQEKTELLRVIAQKDAKLDAAYVEERGLKKTVSGLRRKESFHRQRANAATRFVRWVVRHDKATREGKRFTGKLAAAVYRLDKIDEEFNDISGDVVHKLAAAEREKKEAGGTRVEFNGVELSSSLPSLTIQLDGPATPIFDDINNVLGQHRRAAGRIVGRD